MMTKVDFWFFINNFLKLLQFILKKKGKFISYSKFVGA